MDQVRVATLGAVVDQVPLRGQVDEPGVVRLGPGLPVVAELNGQLYVGGSLCFQYDGVAFGAVG